MLTFNNLPVVNLGPDQSLCPDETVLLDATYPNATYTWQDSSRNRTYLVTKTGWYSVVVDVNHCKASDSVYIDFFDPNCSCSIYVPNAFSPNDDGINDEFKLISIHPLELKTFKIYNRWGNLVFDTTNMSDTWNGNYKGNPADVGTYYYYLKYRCLDTNKEYFIKGDITLIR